MYRLRRWSVRRARLLEMLYAVFERALIAGDPLLRRIDDRRLERAFTLVERPLKRALFDCRMCGACVLSATGMSCPMNCPKQLRNGPCGGVRGDGMCEVVPTMRCVWVEAFEGNRRMADGARIREVQPPIDHRRQGRSSWLAVLQARRAAARRSADMP